MSEEITKSTDISEIKMLTFSSCVVLDEIGKEFKVSLLWKKNPVIFIFLRHFGCITCRAHAAQVWSERDKYEQNGAKIVFIGNGSAQYIKFFKEDLNILDATIYTDPNLRTFQAIGFRRGFFISMGPKALISGFKASKGVKQGESFNRKSGDLWQLGGVLVVRTNGTVAYHYISQILGDYPPQNDIIQKA
jgi:hypothetical protein